MAKYSGAAGLGLKGQFDISVVRGSANLSEKLPFAIFGANALAGGYQSILAVPNGLTLTVTSGLTRTGQNYDEVQFSYTDGTNTDTITVTSSTLIYPELLEASKTDLLLYSQVKMTLNGFANQDQFNENLDLRDNTILGKQESNKLTPASYVNSFQSQSNQVDLPIESMVNARNVILSKFRSEAATINFSFYFTEYQPYSAQ